MGDAGRQHAEGGELFGAFDEGLTFDQFAPHGRDHVAINQPTQHEAEGEQQAKADQHGDAHLGNRVIGMSDDNFSRGIVRFRQLLAEVEQALRLFAQFLVFVEARAAAREGL